MFRRKIYQLLIFIKLHIIVSIDSLFEPFQVNDQNFRESNQTMFNSRSLMILAFTTVPSVVFIQNFMSMKVFQAGI